MVIFVYPCCGFLLLKMQDVVISTLTFFNYVFKTNSVKAVYICIWNMDKLLKLVQGKSVVRQGKHRKTGGPC